MNNLLLWIWLSLSCSPDTPTFSKLIAALGTPEEIYSADEKKIRSIIGSRVSDYSKVINKDLTNARSVYDFCTSRGVGILTYSDEKFPQSLRAIETPPVLLYYRGHVPDFNSGFRCAIVGTRRLSDYGRKNAFTLGYDMASAGATVVSGMAIGIDGVATAGALAAGGVTIAVMGSGIDVCYPMEHKRLAREIVKRGCVFTEYPPGTKPEKPNFPKRNRLISGLAAATVVVEGSERSGALITARYAKKQGRTVYAFPGNVGNVGSQVTNLLIKNGANLCTSADDIVRDFGDKSMGALNPHKLPEKMPVNMHSVLRELEIACVTPSDNIFRTPKPKKQELQSKDFEHSVETNVVEQKSEPDFTSFDKDAIVIYKKIPYGEDCAIDELVDDKYDLRSVSKLLLKLEMGRFVVMLPGDRVKRNNH